MAWLNWSLKLHIWLRTISFLVPTHISHVYVQWMPYSFMWLYLFKCVALTQSYVDQTQKIFLSVFGKCFCFEKFQNLCNSVLVTLSHESSQSQALSRELTQNLSRLPGESSPQSRKRLRKISNFWVFIILWLTLATSSRMEAPVASFT